MGCLSMSDWIGRVAMQCYMNLGLDSTLHLLVCFNVCIGQIWSQRFPDLMIRLP